MDALPTDIIVVANSIVKALLLNTCVESFGVMHQGHFMLFRNDQADNMELYIGSDIIFHPQRHEELNRDERILLGMNSVNLKRVTNAYCTDKADLEVHFEDGSWLRVLGTTEDSYEPWQLSDGESVGEGGTLLIASSGDLSYAIWKPDNN